MGSPLLLVVVIGVALYAFRFVEGNIYHVEQIKHAQLDHLQVNHLQIYHLHINHVQIYHLQII